MFIIRLLRKPLIWLGADFNQLEIILNTKLTADFRRTPSIYKTSGKSKQRTFATQLIVFVFLGLFISFGFFSIHDLLLNFTIAFTVFMVMIATALISEFTSVLFDPQDNLILLVRPISNRTLLLSRLLHIQFYVLYIALALSAAPAVVTFFKYGFLTSVFFISGTILSTWISLLITTLFYLSVSKVVSGERFKDIINYVQILLAIIVMGGYQFLPRMAEIKAFENYSMPIHEWTYLLPPAWLAAWVQLSVPAGVTTKIILLSVPAIVFAIGGGILVTKFLSGGFINILIQLSEGEASTKKENLSKTRRTNDLYRFFCISEYEKTGWKIIMSITSRDRKFKQAVYPVYGFMLVMIFAMLRPNFSDLSGWFQQLKMSDRYLMFLFFGFFTNTSITQMRYTDTPEASWVYRALPITSPGHILSGAIKAMLIKFFIPVYSVLILSVTLIWGIHTLPLMLLGGIMIIITTLITIKIQNTSLPFTQPREMQQKGVNFLRAMLGFIIMGVVIGIVFLASFLPTWSVYIVSVIAIAPVMLIFKVIRRSIFEYTEN
jgi:ABC-2 type transport system permease protein